MAITKRPNGSWLVSIYQPNKPYMRKTFKTREEARQYEVIFKGESAKGNSDLLETFNKVLSGKISKAINYAETITYSEYLVSWHKSRELSGRYTIGTLKRANDFIQGYIIPTLGFYKLSEIDSDKVYLLRDKMKKKGLNGNPLSLRTIKHCYAVIKCSINDAIKKRKLPFNPLADLTPISINDEDVKKIEPISKHHQDRLLKASIQYSNNKNDQRRFILYYMLVNTGMRRGELYGLKWKNINLDKREISIEQQCIYPNSPTEPVLAKLKTKKSKRIIAINTDTVEAIKGYRLWLSEMMLPTPDTPFIADLSGNHLSRDFARSTLKILVKLANVPSYTIHALRHTHGTNCYNAKMPIKNIQERLGHSTITTTMDIYVKPDIKDDPKYLDKANINLG